MNKIEDILIELSLIEQDNIEILSDKVRDRNDVGVKICKDSGIIYLSTTSHIDEKYYDKKSISECWNNSDDWKDSLAVTKDDDDRRFSKFEELFKNKICMDYGCGNGGLLKKIKTISKEVIGIEIQSDIVRELNTYGYNVEKNINATPNNKFDTVSMFHVLEHLINPIETLSDIKNKLKSGGKIIIEVPHANDFLISQAKSKSFMDFTFWSEHLILHTKKSLTEFLKRAGYKNINIVGQQRYPLSNHLYWLSHGKPNGHNIFDGFNDDELISKYEDVLKKLNLTDTIIAIAEK
tara:strand:- start:55441 stop:56319 length:879 start_codon:yes stop_codon:yes gene_type:complete